MSRYRTGALALLVSIAGLAAGPVPGQAASPTPVVSSPDARSSPTPTLHPTPHPTPTPSATPSPRTTTNEAAALKAAILAAIARRLTILNSLKGSITAAQPLTDPDRSALGGQVDASSAGLAALDRRVSAETDPPTLRRDAAAVITDFRIDDLLAPKVHLVIAADTAQSAATGDAQLATRLLAAVAREKSLGRDTKSAEAFVADLQTRVALARAASGGVPASVLPLTAAGFPANAPLLATARASIEAAGADLHAAAADAHQAADGLELLTQADLKASARTLVGERLKTIAGLNAEVRAARNISADDRTGLLTLLSTDQAGLTALGHRIEADTDLKTLRADIGGIYTDYRVYALVVPKVKLVLAAGSIASAAGQVDAAVERISALLEKARESRRDTAGAEAALAAAREQINTARAELAGVNTDLIGLNTAGYPGNEAALAADRRSIESARGELAAAASDARLAVNSVQ